MGFYAILIRNNNGLYLQCDDDNKIVGYTSQREAMASYENMYNEAHASSHERSMSACIHFIMYNPSVFYAKSLPWLKSQIITDPPQLIQMRCVAGSMRALVARSTAMRYWESGTKPCLIKGEPPKQGMEISNVEVQDWR